MDFNPVGVRREEGEAKRREREGKRGGSEAMDVDLVEGGAGEGENDNDIENSEDEETDEEEDAWEDDDDEDESEAEFETLIQPGTHPNSDSDSESEPKAICRTITAPSIIPKGYLFLTDVHSSLPYREITKRVPHMSFEGVMIDDERIICLIDERNVWVHTM